MKFKCKHTGNTVEFFSEHDIKDMQRHPEYTEVVEEVEIKKEIKTKPKAE